MAKPNHIEIWKKNREKIREKARKPSILIVNEGGVTPSFLGKTPSTASTPGLGRGQAASQPGTPPSTDSKASSMKHVEEFPNLKVINTGGITFLNATELRN